MKLNYFNGANKEDTPVVDIEKAQLKKEQDTSQQLPQFMK